jgi:hypothetical protein
MILIKKEKLIRIKDYVCTLEQAIKLKHLGVEQNSQFYFYYDIYLYAAFTSEELGNLIKQIAEYTQHDELNDDIRVFTYEILSHNFSKSIKNRTETQARAEFLIYLLENENIKSTRNYYPSPIEEVIQKFPWVRIPTD